VNKYQRFGKACWILLRG